MASTNDLEAQRQAARELATEWNAAQLERSGKADGSSGDGCR